MPTYYRPGKRGGNAHFVVRGSIDGEPHEKVAGRSKTKRAAQAWWEDYRAEIHRARGRGGSVAFADVADNYCADRDISKADIGFLAKVCAGRIDVDGHRVTFGQIHIASIENMHIGAVARAVYPGRQNATLNRQVFAPVAAVLHYAHDNKLRDYVVVRKLKEAEPETRLPSDSADTLLLANAEGSKRLWLMFVFCQGPRISESLSLRWDKIRLHGREFDLYINKARKWQTMPMQPDFFEALCGVPEVERVGRVFPWETKSGVYRWLRPLAKGLGVTFTPHMARHQFASDLRRVAGAVDRDITDVGTWTSEKSVKRYTGTPDKHAHDVIGRLSRRKTGG
jgi:integrase